MKWSWRIATIAGIPIYVHGTFLVLIGFILFSGVAGGRELGAVIASALFLLAIFFTIVLHELGHALTARRFGIRTRDITLLPIGGLARLERMPDVPRQELWVALAGPAVNLAIAAGCYLALMLTLGTLPELAFDPSAGVVERFTVVNLSLAVFNLVPAFPMDGGRMLRALLAERLDYVRATEIAANIGQGLALLFGFVGLFSNPFLVFIALFVWMGASSEASMVSLRSALAGIPVSRAMLTDFHVLEAASPLQEAVDLVLAGSQRDFPVIEGGALVGVLTRDAMMAALGERGAAGAVQQVMTRNFEVADAREMLESAFQRLESGGCPVLPVLDGGRLVGLLTSDNVGEYVMIRGALRPGRGRPWRGGTRPA
ncbi:MAG: site-2 protease family protein [Vicinamibacterales bacterium]|jgi:Zn-dependent protease/CBS domain-containing protein|nr:site-2 protease family protein [Acidobacteriota bacterium]MDP7671031.1 site-2 protease family protein [Vicinamibacterales bacterium]HJO38724.1 site-2 protease family protein [Vicinamibacterales bacterium]|tara:strand:- start:2042 stop:3154 length:1113 start_codon:yes stop_codon:yes gene_type:complete